MDRALAEEASRLLGSARAWLEEWAEEGVVRDPAAAAEPARTPRGAPPRPEPGAPEEAQEETEGPAPDRPASAPHPGPAPAAGDDGPRAATGAAPTALAHETLFAATPGGPPTLETVRETLGECTRCPLHEGRSRIVFGDGNPDADLMFIGEGPGEQEDRQGLPFVGRAGELLTRMIERGLGIPRRDVYICNIVKCRPPGNRAPLAHEVAACRGFLDGQIDAVRPRVIVTLGKPAASLLLGRDVSITRIRGTWHDYRGTPVMPTFHPAFILRQYTEENRRLVWQDLKEALHRARGG